MTLPGEDNSSSMDKTPTDPTEEEELYHQLAEELRMKKERNEKLMAEVVRNELIIRELRKHLQSWHVSKCPNVYVFIVMNLRPC